MKACSLIITFTIGVCFFACSSFKIGVTEQIKKAPHLDVILVYTFNDPDSLNINVVDLNTGKLVKREKIEKVESSYVYITSKKQGRILKEHIGFQKIFDSPKFDVWSSGLDPGLIHITKKALLFYDIEENAIRLDGQIVNISKELLDTIPERYTLGNKYYGNEVYPLNSIRLRLINNRIYFIDKNGLNKTRFFSQTDDQINTMEIDYGIQDVLTGYDDLRIIFGYDKHCAITGYDILDEQVKSQFKIPDDFCSRLEYIGRKYYVLQIHSASILGYRENLYLINLKRNNKIKLFQKSSEYGYVKSLNFGIIYGSNF